MNKLFDSHAHYFDKKFDTAGGADGILLSADFEQSVCGVINVATNCDNAIECIEQAKKYPFMYTAVGIHPSDAQSLCDMPPSFYIERLRELVCDDNVRKANKTVAIGEIGFDYYWKPVDKALQYEYFDGQMRLAREYGIPVIIHDREAHADTLDMIFKHRDVVGVLHSCSMSAESVRELTCRGWYISFSGTLTFKNAERVRQACAAVPIERLLIETDAPYLAPTPFRGQINNSMLMMNTAKAAAEIFGISADEMCELTARNARNLFKI